MKNIWKKRCENRISGLLNDKTINAENRKLWKKFFKEEENKLKRSNGLTSLDDKSYNTLYAYCRLFSNINRWLGNKAWKDLTKNDFKKFYNDFEDGKLLNQDGKPCLSRDRYYNSVFCSVPFEMINKRKMVKEVMRFHKRSKKKEVRFITEEDFRKLVSVVVKPSHRLLCWLHFDIGENINSLLRLKKKDFHRQIEETTNIPEYRVNLKENILKRSRTPRSEITNYKETTELLDILLKKLEDDDLVFDFEYRNAMKFLDRAVKITEVKCQPNNDKVTWKDLRSSMACDLLKKGWSRDEVNARLGHKPSSTEIDAYINFLALDRHKPKKKIYEHNLARIQGELEKSQERERLTNMRMEQIQERLKGLELKDKIVKRSIEKKQILRKESVRAILKEMAEAGEI